MTKQELSMYPTLKKRVQKLENDIEELRLKDIDVVSGKVKGSMRGHPYTERRFTVEMEVPEEAEKVNDAIKKKKAEIFELEIQLRKIEGFIDGIEDVLLKTIFECTYIDGMTQSEVGEKVGLDRSRISRKISDFLKTHTKHRKSML